jgi:hypothetical protein
MRTKGLVLGLLLSSIVFLAPTSGDCVSHESHNNLAPRAERLAILTPIVGQTKVAANNSGEEFESYVEVFNEVDSDPEHAAAHKITASYDIH